MTPFAYLGTPYTKYKDGIEAAFREASKLAARLLQAGIIVYSPIAHTHPIAIHGKLDAHDLSIWLPFDEAIMTRCDVLIVAHMDGWQDSKGIAYEIAFFEKANKPIFDLDVESLAMIRRAKTEFTGDPRMKWSIKDMPPFWTEPRG
jgi:hypothetical protein